MSTTVNGNAGNSCTTLEERDEFARLPPGTKGYLAEKAEYALNAPKVIRVKLKDGSIVQRVLLQLVMSGTIRADEAQHDYLWQYKSEVTYDMWPARMLDGKPRPFLSSSDLHDPLRRHSLSVVPKGAITKYWRRPDVTIVTNPALRWPGLATTDHQGVPHPDNVLRIVELKFPGDDLDKPQELAYLRIAGNDAKRLAVVDVHDCNGVLETVRQPAPRPAPTPPVGGPSERRHRAPVRSVQPIPEPVFYEAWLREAGETVEAVWAALQAGVAQLSAKSQAWLRREAPWLFQAGRWVRDTAGQTYAWVDEHGRTVLRWTLIQLRNAWQAIAAQTDLTWQQLEHLDWGQLLIDTFKGLCVLALVVGGVVVAVVLAEALMVALLAIVAIVAQMGAAAAAAIGMATLATAAAR